MWTSQSQSQFPYRYRFVWQQPQQQASISRQIPNPNATAAIRFPPSHAFPLHNVSLKVKCSHTMPNRLSARLPLMPFQQLPISASVGMFACLPFLCVLLNLSFLAFAQEQGQQPQEQAATSDSQAIASRDLRRAPQKGDEPKCGTAELSYQPCTSKSVANKLFLACCEQFVAPECHFLCQYETDHGQAKKMLLQAMNSRCGLKPLSGVLYCASQNRDNRQCCQDLDLNSPQLLVGSRCLRMCDPAGTQLGKLDKEDATCLYNWNVIMYCHHSGIREM